jgi:hypothetical protein
MAFEWNPDLENQLFENWWSGTFVPSQQSAIEESARRNKSTYQKEAAFFLSPSIKAQARTGSQSQQAGTQWSSYLNSYLQTQVQQSLQQAEAGRTAQQAQIAKAEEEYAAAAKQAEEAQTQAKRISTFSDYQGQQLARQERQASALAMQSETQPVQGRKKTQIGQPGVSRTRVSSGIGIGGYGGTGAGNVNPTGLNI